MAGINNVKNLVAYTADELDERFNQYTTTAELERDYYDNNEIDEQRTALYNKINEEKTNLCGGIATELTNASSYINSQDGALGERIDNEVATINAHLISTDSNHANLRADFDDFIPGTLRIDNEGHPIDILTFVNDRITERNDKSIGFPRHMETCVS
jgi:hypothetical protein